MQWDAIGAVGEILGATAVFITLGYLAVQVRGAREELQRSIGQTRMEISTQLAKEMANERTAAIFLKADAGLGAGVGPLIRALMDRTGLTAEEAWHLTYWNFAWWGYRAHIIQHVVNLPGGQRAEFDAGIRSVYGAQDGIDVSRLWYDMMKSQLSPDAVRYVDNLLNRSD